MSKDEYDTHLKYGQGIIIEGFKTDGYDTGYLTAQGFADIKVKYQTSDDILYFKNYRNSLFKILPAGSFELNDELQKALVQNQGHEDTPNIRILRARAQSEKYQFDLSIANHMKKKICFGAGVIFQHLDSNAYISGTIKPSTGSNGAFTVQVSQKLSDSLVFKLMPYRSFEFTDMPIPFESPIIIRNEFNNGYLTFEKIGMADDSNTKGTYINKKPIQSNETYNIPVKTPSLTSQEYEVVTHFVDLSVEKEVPMPWRFKLHVNNVQNDILVQHDVVFLQHTQNAGILATAGKNIILKELKERENEQLPFYDCLWQIQKHDATPDAYILRHLMSGMILGQQIGLDNQRRALLIDISNGKPEQGQISYIQVKLAKKEGGDINSQSFVNIAWGQQILEIDDAEGGLASSANKAHDPNAKIDLNKMRQLYKKQIQYEIRPLVFRKNVAQEHCFTIMEIPDELKEQLLFALSFHSVIIRLREDLKYGAIQAAKKISYLRMMQVTYKIRQIKKFIKNCSQQEAQLEHFFPEYKLQMICKDLGISELLFQLLYFMKMNLREDIFSDQHNQRQKFMELYDTLYEVNRQLIRHNYLFKMHVSKWFEFVLDDVIAGDVPCQLSLLKEILDKNQFFIANFINQNIVEYLTFCFNHKSESTQFTEKKYLQIFQLFCISGSNVNTNNQKLIVDYFVKKIANDRVFEVKLQEKDGNIVVKASLDKKNQISLPFAEFYRRSQQENPSAWLYFVQYLNLMADLTQGRNKITELEVSKIFSLNILGDLFERQTLHEAQIPIIRLLHYLYAQSQYYYPIEKRRRLLNYHSIIEQSISLNSTHSPEKPWEAPLDRILNRLLERTKEFGAIETRDAQGTQQGIASYYFKNKVLLTLLHFLWETVNLGFWNTKESAKQILNFVLEICKKGQNINYQQARIQSKQNLVMIDCKIQCLNIIQLLAYIDNDIFVQNIASKFRQLEFPPKKLDLQGMLNNSLMDIRCDNDLIANFMPNVPSQQQLQPIIETSICDQMIELTNYRNPELTSSAISIIDLALQSRKKAFQQFYELIIVSEDERLKLVEFMEVHRNKFFILDDQNTPLVNQDNQICNYFMVNDPEGQGLMEVLYLLTELMKNQNNILQIQKVKSIHQTGVFSALGSDRLVNFTGQRSSTSRMKQQIIYSSNLYKKVLNYIFNCAEIPEEQLALKLLHMCYYFIVALIENFNQIKAQMQWHIPKMIHHIQRNVGCIDFLKEMYDNNKGMLYNEIQVFELIKKICENIEKQPEDSYYKSKLLDFFRYLIYCNGRCLRSHQIQILKIMQDDSYQNIMISASEDIAPLIQQYERDNADSQEVVMSPKLTYICSFFQIMSSLIDNSNPVNIGKLIKKYSFERLVNLIEVSGKCWALKRNLRGLINRLYYFQKGVDVYLKPIISREIPNLAEDLHLYIVSKHDPNKQITENKKFQNPVRFSYIQSYRYLLLEESLFTLMSITQDEVMSEVAKHLNKNFNTDLQASYNIFKVLERLGWLQIFFTNHKNTYTNSLIKFLLSKMKPLLLSLDQPAIFSIYGDISNFESKNKIINKITCGNIGRFYEQNSPELNVSQPLSYLIEVPEETKGLGDKTRDEGKLRQILRQIFLRQKKDFQNEDQRISYNLNQLVSSLKLSVPVQKYFRDEYLEKVDTYYKRKNKYKFIRRIIALNSRKPNALTADQKIFFLQFVTGYIESGNQNLPQPEEGEPRLEIDQWDPEHYSDSKQNIDKIQINLKKRDLGKFIVDLFKQDLTNNIELANSILLCAIAYLLGGNQITQKNVLEQLQKDQENKVFANIEALIFILGKLIRKNIDQINTQKDEANAQSNEFTPDRIDNYDFFDVQQKYTMRKNVSQPNSTDEFIYNKLCITTYRRAFKFLQIMCQNNCQDGKHMIRKQEGKARQFNFIDIATKELRSLFQIYCAQIKVVPLYILEFLKEVTQNPIYQNQTALMNSTFFQDLCQLKNSFSFNDPEMLAKKLLETNFQDMSDVNQIFYASLELILINFEGNDDRTFQALDSKLEVKFLIDVMREKLISMNIENYNQLVAHIDAFNDMEDEEGNKNTGFDDDILIILNIITIYKKMMGAKVLANNSRLVQGYQKFKKQLYQNEKQRVTQLISDRVEDVPDKPEERDAIIEMKVEARMKKYKCLYQHLETLLLSIEVTDDNGKIQTVFFPNYPVFSSITSNLRDHIMENVNRESHRDKIVTLLAYTDGVKEKIQYSYNLEKKKNITESNMDDSFKVASTLSIILCVYIAYFYQVNVQYHEAQYYAPFTISAVRFGLSFIQLIFTILFVFYWFQLRLWRDPQTINREGGPPVEQGEEGEAPAGDQQQEEDQEGQAGPVAIQIAAQNAQQPAIEQADADAPPEAQDEEAPLWRKRIPKPILEKVDKLNEYKAALTEQLQTEEQRIYKNVQLWKNGVFLLASVIGTFYFPPMFFLHLILILARVEKLGTILKAAVFNYKSLMYMYALGFVFTYIFSTVTFSNYMKNVYSSSDSVQDMCDEVVGCVAQLTVSGAIGETMQGFELVRFSYDMVYFIFFQIMFGSIVSSLMLDAFSSLREQQETRSDDQDNKCYICQVSRQTLEKEYTTFQSHIKQKHYLWNYLFYIYVLERKDETDYTGLEYVIRNQYYKPDEQMEVNWIPYRGGSEFDVVASAEKMTEDLKSKIEIIAEKKSTLDDTVNQFKKMARQYL